MAVYYSVKDLPRFNSVVVTIGSFDGLHTGHQTILDTVKNHAKQIGGESVVITFEPHPRKLIFPDLPISILTPTDKKIQLMTSEGINHVVVVPFTHDFAAQTADEYIADFLVRFFQPAAIVIGYDHHFGNDRKGNIELLKAVQKKYGFDVVEIPAQQIEDAAISSTKIRKALSDGSVEDAAQMLGRCYSLAGKVVRGVQLGRTIGFPTANIAPSHSEQLIPANGVYAIKVIHAGSVYDAMLNIGVRPTVSSEMKLHIEAHIFDFDQDIYNEQLDMEFVARLRDEQKFSSVDELKKQLSIDAENALSILRA